MSQSPETVRSSGHPVFDEDIYSAAPVAETLARFKEIRDLGPAVWLSKHDMWAIGRFDDVRAALRADTSLVSSKGVAANDFVNSTDAPMTLTSDGDVHARRRAVLMRPVSPVAMRDLKARVVTESDALVDRLCSSATFDAMSEFAAYLPVTIVSELVGLTGVGRDNMLAWAAATFDALGGQNERLDAAGTSLMEMMGYAEALERDKVVPGGWVDRLFDAADKGELSPEEARAMAIDYVAPGLDTTILAAGHLIWLLASHPEAFEALKQNPELVPGIINECVRLASPIRAFTRVAAEAYEVGNTRIAQGDRVAILYASANRDERHYPDPDNFDINRNPRDHVGWGHGAHTCAGMHLARLELEALLRALAGKVSRIEADAPEPLSNNVLQGIAAMPARFVV